MAGFLLPITLFSKTYSYSFAETTMMIAFPIFVLIILLQLYRFPNRIRKIIPSLQSVLLAGFFLVMQLVTMLISYSQSGDSTQTTGILRSVVFLVGWVITVYMSWAIISITITNNEEEKLFIKSGLIALMVYIVIVLLPQLLVSFNNFSIRPYVNFLADLFERHWKGRDFYWAGSYSVTNYRLNGFEPEAAFLANLLGVVYLPIILGMAITEQKNFIFKNNKFSSRYMLWLFAAVLLGFLVLARTTTGIITFVIAVLLWFLWSKKADKLILLVLGLLGVSLAIIGYVFVNPIHDIFYNFLFNKQGTSNRLGGTIALILTFLSHPIFGVGYGFTGYFIMDYVPKSTTHNVEFQEVYRHIGYPILSDSVGWFASYGLIIMLPALWLLARLIIRSLVVQKELRRTQPFDWQWHLGIQISFIVMIILAAVSSLFVIQIFLWPYLLMFFFYRQSLINQEEVLSL
ncbi:MAG: O-antigen ligase family protein [Leuconostoc pseudomesenteroides]|uniref:O-antigen ligase family protein n=1 Tax=Leuconostoc pseudomesenteroides TaxID=33968 RepID=UPI0039ECFCAC